MQSAVRDFADELRLERGLNLTLRIGLNTGEVVVGRIGDDLRMDYTAQGATVNLAARLEQICEPGQVYLSRATAIQAQGPFAMRSLGDTRVDGVERPVEVFALEGHGRHETRLERVFQLCYGRPAAAQERALVAQLWEELAGHFRTHIQKAADLVGTSADLPVPLAEAAAWGAVARVLMNTDEFITRE